MALDLGLSPLNLEAGSLLTLMYRSSQALSRGKKLSCGALAQRAGRRQDSESARLALLGHTPG